MTEDNQLYLQEYSKFLVISFIKFFASATDVIEIRDKKMSFKKVFQTYTIDIFLLKV